MGNPWFELPDLMKADLILSAIDALFFPYKAPWCGPDSPDKDVIYENYLEMASKQGGLNGFDDINDLSRFWRTDSIAGSDKIFTDRIKKIVDYIYPQFFDDGWHGWFLLDCVRFTAYKSRSVKLEVIIEGEVDEFSSVEFPCTDDYNGRWDSWSLGFIELMIHIINYVVEKSQKIG